MASKPNKETLYLLERIYHWKAAPVNRKYQPQTWQPEIKKLIKKEYVKLIRIGRGSVKNPPGQSYLVLTDKGINTIPLSTRKIIDIEYKKSIQ